MKRKLEIICSALVILAIALSCNYKVKNTKAKCTLKVKDITLSNRADTLSYALGIVWSGNIGKYLGLNKISYAFYSGVQDYLQKDSSIMGIYAANNYLNNHRQDINYETFVTNNDSNSLVCDIPLKTKYDSFSYALGFCWCSGSYEIGISEVTPALLVGLPKGLRGDTSLFNPITANNYLMAYVDELRLIRYSSIKRSNEQFLSKNKKNSDIVVLPNGLQYRVLTKGKGACPSEDEIVECNYISRLIDGKVIENTYRAGRPEKLYISSSIDGLHEALKIMHEGDKWIVFIPCNLAYGSGGIKDLIPPYSALIYELELIKVHKK